MKQWHLGLIGLLLIAVTFFATLNYRNEQVLNLQAQLEAQTNGIIATTNLLQKGFDSGQLNIQNFINLGWDLSIPKRTQSSPKDSL